MRIWVDADACPGEVKEIIIKAALRLAINTQFVANKDIRLPPSPFLEAVRVPQGFDVADGHIASGANSGDLAITADIPLASLLVPKGVVVIDPRGEVMTPLNIGERLALRNFMQEMRSGGTITGGPAGYGAKDKQKFAAAFDAALTRLVRAANASSSKTAPG